MWQSRIAPTPSGFLHIGNAFNFLLTRELTERYGTSLRLRIDDLDAPRMRQEYLQDIFDTLTWLGIKWQTGPMNSEEQKSIYSQRLRMDRYHLLIAKLIETGRIYACNCSRANHTAIDICRNKKLPYNTPGTALKIRVDAIPVVINDCIAGKQIIKLEDTVGDFVIRRKDGLPAYQVASLSDDIDFSITAIVRGHDLMESTAAQLYLAKLINEQQFLDIAFYHHPLISNATGTKLSKSAGSDSLKSVRDNHIPAGVLRDNYQQWRNSFHVL